MVKTGFFVGNDAGHVVIPCERRVKAKSRVNKGKKIKKSQHIILEYKQLYDCSSHQLYDFSTSK